MGTYIRDEADQGSLALTPELTALVLRGFDVGQAIIALYSPDDEILFASRGFRDLFELQSGCPTFRDMMRHCHAVRLGPRIESMDIESWLDAASAKRRSRPDRSFEVDFIDGRFVWARETTFDGGYILLTMLDVSHLKHAEQALRDAKVAEARRFGMIDLADRFEQSVMITARAVSKAAHDTGAAAAGISRATREANDNALAVELAVMNAADTVAEVALATRELIMSVEHIARSVSAQVDAVSLATASSSGSGAAIAQLQDDSEAVASFVTTIDAIAGSSRMLALNATIEAARAGQAGRGFAVVAQEVKGLAMQTGAATARIRSLIETIQSGTRSTRGRVDEVGKAIGKVELAAGAITAVISEQRRTVQNVDRCAARAAADAESVSSDTRSLKAAVALTGTCSASLDLNVSGLLEQSATLIGLTDDFTRKMRAI